MGVLAVPCATIEVLPKITGEGPAGVRAALTRMLSVAWGLKVADSEPAMLSTQRKDLLEVLIRLFADRLLVAVRRGLPHRYRSKEDDLTYLRGSLDIKRQFTRHAARSETLACRFEELSVDTPLNRVLKAAVARLAFTSRSDANMRKLGELLARFDLVGETPHPNQERVRLDRTNDAFHRLYGLARRLLGGEWQNTATGRSEGFALLFPMNDLFEEFIGRSMKIALAPRAVSLQDTGRHSLEGRRERLFALRPDIVVDGGIVIDTKWKQLRPEERTLGVAQADVYQMLAYGRAYEARRLVLLYPWHDSLARRPILRRWRVAGTDTVFDICAVDVGRPELVLETLREIVVGA